MRIVFHTDTHFRGTAPENRTDDFFATQLRKLDEVLEIAQEEGASAILHGGDLFDRPDTAHSVVAEVFRRYAASTIPTYIVQGNHDEYGMNPETVQRAMFGLGTASGLFRQLSERPVFLREGGFAVQLTGSPYRADIDTETPREGYILRRKNADIAIHVVHGMFLLKPFMPIAHTLPDQVVEETFADLTLTGHEHVGFRPQTYDGKTIANPGALVRTNIHRNEIARMPQVAIVEIDGSGMHVRYRKLKSARPGEEVMDRSLVEETVFRHQRLQEFAAAVAASGESNLLTIEEMLNRVATDESLSSPVRDETMRRIATAQEQVGTEGVA